MSLSFYYSYVDDITLAINQNYIEELLNIFNNFQELNLYIEDVKIFLIFWILF